MELYRSAIAAADPLRVTTSLLEQLQPPDPHRTVWLFAVGKAAHGMAVGLTRWLEGCGHAAPRGIAISTTEPSTPLPGIEYLVGDHPVPGARSFAASERLAACAASVKDGDVAFVLISGGTSSLIGAPLSGISRDEYVRTFVDLLGSGVDIGAMNAARKQISRWANGRLAAALHRASVQPIIISDVVTDDPATIGSGPCTPPVVHALNHVATPLIAGHDLPVHGAMLAARQRGLRVIHGPELIGEARVMGAELGRRLVAMTLSPDAGVTAMICGGETTVTLGEERGLGGRCQELALSAAEILAGREPTVLTMLAAGTDGRDGPTDAAGAIIDGGTWPAIREAGRDPSDDLARHNAYAALDSANALVRTGPTGTNMLDVVIAIARPRQTHGSSV